MPDLRSQPGMLSADAGGLSECLDRLAARKRELRPLATYRLQFNREFRFEDARRLAPYLHDLGISHCYASPILAARAGSTHGYDITDHNRLNAEIGTEEEFRAFSTELRAHGMGLVLDVVPNHMGVGHGSNPWWQDVLRNGRASAYAGFFDIDWNPFKPELRNKVLLPILGDRYGHELEQGRLRLEFEGGRFRLHYYEKRLGIDPQTVPLIFAVLGDLRSHCDQANGADAAELSELENLLEPLRNLPPNHATDAEQARRRQAEAPVLRQRLGELAARSPLVRSLIQKALARINGEPGDSRSWDALHRLLEAQAYRLAHWQVSAEEINYRRFFDVNDLVGLRMENPQVFAATHQLLRRLLAEGRVTGLRIDHPDGLLNPLQYFVRLQMLYAASQCRGAEPQPPLAENGVETGVQEIFGQHNWMDRQALLYVTAEKVLGPGESLPEDWPVDGTSGYDFARLVNGIFVDRRSERAFTILYRRFIGHYLDVETVVYESKKLIMHTALSSEITVLAHVLDEISLGDRYARDFTRKALADAIRETIACFPVYRTYIDERGQVSERDRGYIHEAIARAKRRNPGSPPAVFDFLRDILLLHPGSPTQWTDEHRRRLYFTLKFQQLTGPVMAKGLEDTTCYVYNRFVAMNEVGTSPKEFGLGVDEFHRGNLERAEKWPFSMLATSTHDSKRSKDVRARLDVLSEMPQMWAANVMRWRRLNRARKRTLADGRHVPDTNEEYMLYQALVGAWPFGTEKRDEFTRRMQDYVTKAVHEAKANLSWISPNPEYVEALRGFVERILRPGTASRPNHFLEELERFLPPVMLFGAVNSLAQVLLKITCPGVPDLYQGAELWDFSLVDPDNRRPVDFELRRRLPAELKEAAQRRPMTELCDELMRSYPDGRIKMWTTMRALCFRREHRELFHGAPYLPLYATGSKQEHVVAFARSNHDRMAVVAAPRLSYRLAEGDLRPPLGELWAETQVQLPRAGEFVNVFTGEVLDSGASRTLSCREIFAHFPVALLASR